MIRIDTTGDFAKVINLPVFRYWSFVMFITKSVCRCSIKSAITFSTFSCCPNPASVSFFNFCQKSFNCCWPSPGAWLVVSGSPVCHVAPFAHSAFNYVNRLWALGTTHGSCCSLNFSRYLSHLPQQCVTHSLSLVSMSTPRSTGSSMLAHSGHDVGRYCAAARWPWILRSMLCQTSLLILKHLNPVLNCLYCILLVLHSTCQ